MVPSNIVCAIFAWDYIPLIFRPCFIKLHSTVEIFLDGSSTVEIKLFRRIDHEADSESLYMTRG